MNSKLLFLCILSCSQLFLAMEKDVHNNRWICPMGCRVNLRKPSIIKKHLEEKHPDKSFFICKANNRCKYVFDSQTKVDEHILANHSFACPAPHCKKAFSTIDGQKTHLKKNHCELKQLGNPFEVTSEQKDPQENRNDEPPLKKIRIQTQDYAALFNTLAQEATQVADLSKIQN